MLEDNGIGVSYDSSSNIGDITSRGADTKAQGERRKQVQDQKRYRYLSCMSLTSLCIVAQRM